MLSLDLWRDAVAQKRKGVLFAFLCRADILHPNKNGAS